MIITKDNPQGIDVPLQKLQKLLYGKLCATWGLDQAGDDYRCYGRAYKNEAEEGYLPEVYIGDSEYRDAFYDDGHKVVSFFGVGDTRTVGLQTETDAFIVFQLNIAEVKPTITHRGDEEVHMDVLNALMIPAFGFTIKELVTDIYNVFEEYRKYAPRLRRNTESIKFRDMHPWHVFRVNLALIYHSCN